MGMKRLVAIALVLAGVALPMWAQRGGGRGGPVGHGLSGFGSGGRSELSSGVRWSTAPQTRYSLGSAPQFSSSRALPALRPGLGPALRIGAGNAGRRPVYPGIYRRPAYGVGIPYGVGWIGPNGFGYADPGFYDGPGYDDPGAPATPANYPAQGYDGPPFPEQPAPDAYRPPYGAAAPAPGPENVDAVTLVFKDGRPSEEIHNYLLTRTTLYVRDQRRREIPVDEIDLAATQRVNRAAGVEFQLPGGAK